MKRVILILAIFILSSLSCSLPLGREQGHQENGGTLQSPQTPKAASEKRCGDNVCDGPENADNCPQDCTQPDQVSGQAEIDTKGGPAAGAQEIQPAELVGEPDSGYRYVSFSGTISTSLNTELMGDFAGTAFEYSGDYSIELWFPLEGGQAIQQRNSIILTEFKDLYFGDIPCTPCEWALDESAFEPVSFELDAALILDNIMENDQPADELVYQILEVPLAVITGVVGCPCPGAPDNFSDPAAFPQLLGWFMQKLVNPIHLNVLETNSVANYAVSPMGYLNIPQETLSYLIVANLDTP